MQLKTPFSYKSETSTIKPPKNPIHRQSVNITHQAMLQSTPKSWKDFLKSPKKPTSPTTPPGSVTITPNTTSPSVPCASPRPAKIPSRDPFQTINPGLDLSFANILNKSLANHETCFICGELLSTVFASERILKLNCGDSTHSECFKAYFKEDIPHARIHGKTITFAKTCRGLNCSGTRNVVVDVNNWHLVSARKLSLIPKRPAPPHPNSVNINALKTTLQNSDIPTRSPSPDPTVSTTTEVDAYEVETVRNQLIKYLLDLCPKINLSRLVLLGNLRVADELSVCVEPLDYFQTRYVYLFENYMLIWNSVDYPVFVPMQNIQISSRGSSILQVRQKDDGLSTLIQSTSSTVVEKWVVAISDAHLQLPAPDITSTIDTSPSDSDSDIDSDEEVIQQALTKNNWADLMIEIDNALLTSDP